MRAFLVPPTAGARSPAGIVATCLRRTPIGLYLSAVVPATLILLVATLQRTVPLGRLTRDPLIAARETGTLSVLNGLLSNLGVLGLAASVGAAASGAAIVLAAGAAGRRYGAFMLAGAAIGGVLALDDLLMLHENARLAPFGGERAVLVLYGLMTAGYLVVFRREILVETHGGLLMLALALFAASAAVDAIGIVASPRSLYWLAEDGTKFVGISAWTAFQIAATVDAARLAAGRRRA